MLYAMYVGLVLALRLMFGFVAYAFLIEVNKINKTSGREYEDLHPPTKEWIGIFMTPMVTCLYSIMLLQKHLDNEEQISF